MSMTASTDLRERHVATTEERLARIEGGYEHMATKADIAATKADIAETKADIAVLNEKVDAIRGELRLQRWALGIVILAQLAIIGRVFEIIPPG